MSLLEIKSKLLKNINLTEIKIIRYADGFKLFCRDRGSIEKMFELVKIFLKDRLKLDISEKKSKIVNLKKQYSNFLGIKLKAVKNRKKYMARSYVTEKIKEVILTLIRNKIRELQRRLTAQQVLKLNSIILGIQNYYHMVSMTNIDFEKIGYIASNSLMNRIEKSFHEKDRRYELRYKGYNFKVWTVVGIIIFMLQAIKFKMSKLFTVKKEVVIEEKSVEKITVEIKEIDDPQIKAISIKERNSTCEVMGKYIIRNDKFYIHRIIPKEYGGTDTS